VFPLPVVIATAVQEGKGWTDDLMALALVAHANEDCDPTPANFNYDSPFSEN
jgi:hypothetical protein